MSEWPRARLGDITTQVRDIVPVTSGNKYPLLGVRWYAGGAFHRETVTSETSKAKTLYRVTPGQFIYNRLFAWKGSFGLVPPEFAGHFVSNEFPLFECDRERIVPEYLAYYFGQASQWSEVERVSTGTTASRNRWKEDEFKAHAVPLPPLAVQHRTVDLMSAVDAKTYFLSAEVAAARRLLRARREELVARDSPIVPLQEAFAVLMGRQRAPQHATGPYMTNYLRSANVGDGALDLSDVKQMNFTPSERKKFALKVGDVLVSEGSASNAAVGMAAVWRGEIDDPICFQKTLLRFRYIEGVSTPPYTYQWCQWAYESGTFLAISSGTNIKHITAVRVLDMPVSLPSLEEQEAIGRELDSMQTHHAAVRNELADHRAFRSTLLTALLTQETEIPESYDDLLKKVS